MSPTLPAHASGTFTIGERTVHRLGFGTMRLTGPGIWGEPVDRAECVAVVRRAVELGVDLIDTADSYGPAVSEDIIREALHPYPSHVLIASKAGLVRTGPDAWFPVARPRYLRQQAEMSLRRLRLDCIPLFQLHRIDEQVPLADSLGALVELRDEGKIEAIGLSEVGIAGDRRGSGDHSDSHGAEPLQPHPPTVGARCRVLRGEWHRVHSVVSDRGRTPRGRGAPPR